MKDLPLIGPFLRVLEDPKIQSAIVAVLVMAALTAMPFMEPYRAEVTDLFAFIVPLLIPVVIALIAGEDVFAIIGWEIQERAGDVWRVLRSRKFVLLLTQMIVMVLLAAFSELLPMESALSSIVYALLAFIAGDAAENAAFNGVKAVTLEVETEETVAPDGSITTTVRPLPPIRLNNEEG